LDYYSPWEQNSDGTKRRIKAFFRKKADRDLERSKVLERFHQFGQSAGAPLTTEETADYRAARALLPAGVTLLDAARAYADKPSAETPPLADVFAAYERSMHASGLSAPWICNVRSTLDKFRGAMPDKMRIGEVTTDHVRRWMEQLKAKVRNGRRVGGYTDESRNNFRRRLHAAFEFAVRENEWTHLTVNPIARVEAPPIHRGPPGFYSVAEARALLAAALLQVPDFAPFLVLRMFAGLRRTEVLRMLPEDIDAKRHIISLPGFRKGKHGSMQRVTKSGKARVIEDLPPVIWQWLERFPKRKVTSHNEGFRAIFRAAHVAQKRNGFRHSFPTYHVALKQSASQTILILGQEEDSKVFYAHYRNPSVTKEEAEVYFSLGPDSVLPVVAGDVSASRI
jgi:integrase